MQKTENPAVAETLVKLGAFQYQKAQNEADGPGETKQQAIYIAGPDVFEKDAIEIGKRLNQLCADYGYKGLFPLDNQIECGGGKIEKARAIFEANKELILEADFVIANLNDFRGKEPDSGTVWECGYASALGKDVFIYMKNTDHFNKKFTPEELHWDEDLGEHMCEDNLIVDNFDMPVNLMLGCCNNGIIQGGFEEVLKMIAKGKTQKVETADFVYDGEWRVGPEPKHGKGQCVWKDGQTYEGHWLNDKPEGFGRMIYADGSYFIGDWKIGKKEGRGVHTYVDGAQYSGLWK